MDDVEEINSDNACAKVEIVDPVLIYQNIFIMKERIQILLLVDDTIRSISFPIRQNFVRKGYICRRNATSGECIICDESIVIR